jgi:LPXTG-motif cell wall-anchored protein
MKRILLTVSGIVALTLAMTLAGSVYAQTGAGAGDQPAAAQTVQTPPPGGSADNPGARSGQVPATDTTSPSSAAPVQAQADAPVPAKDAGSSKHEGPLPATASDSPLMALIGVLALGAFTILLVVRRRGTANS